jgi:hypothetical protein
MKSRYNLFLIFIAIILTNCNNDSKPDSPFSTTDGSKHKDTAILATAPLDTTGCIAAIYRILESSTRFKELTDGLSERIRKNGGTSYGLMLEGSPNPKRDTAMYQSTTYDISLHESYPDRIVIVARFSFDPEKKELYEYEVANDSLVSRSFDKRLLSKLCQ